MSSAAYGALVHVLPAELACGRPYVERDEREPQWHDRFASAVWHTAGAPVWRMAGARERRAQAVAARVQAQAAEIAELDDAALREQALALRASLRRQGFAAEPVARLFALVREAASRVVGQRHYETQLAAGWSLLQGALVEMATGEGKTFAATLPAVTAALAGLPVHVITVNDYLADRDAAAMGPLYRFFGLRVSAVVHGMTPAQRRAAYGGDVTYASNKELAFDYLRDRAALGDRASELHLALEGLRDGASRAGATVLRGMVFGIIDEADSVLIDEARTPLILSTMVDGSVQRAACEAALSLARRLAEGEHFEVDPALRRVRLTDAGRDMIDALDASSSDESTFASARERDEFVQRALAAVCLYALDHHYVVVDGKVQIVDESTGRAMPDRAWERGLHQMIEVKEGLQVSGVRETIARITYQRLFRRYLRLAGMTGTAMEVAAEIGRTYGLPVVRVPLHRPSRRTDHGVRCLRDAAAKWQAVADAVERVALRERRPVLIGTRTVRSSEEVSAVLHARGIEHVVLNARQDREEAAIVARAGEPGRVTVATNMAGRGTDIALAPGVAERGGLHVILTEYHESRRIDRQLIGRSARQGDPGSHEAIVALDDELFVHHAPALTRAAREGGGTGGIVRRPAVAALRRLAQVRAERRNRDAREAALKQDRHFVRLLAFTGRGE
jgi:preprotein translocase subunit SecA